jgi:mannose/fructose/N-acetylgalactosamine-specific phosphotransferase system component IIB
MLDNISKTTTTATANTSQNNSQSQQQSSASQVTLDFDSILQELKSVGEAHQPEQQTTMIVENITANMKQESQLHINSNNTGNRKKSEGRKSSNQSSFSNKEYK